MSLCDTPSSLISLSPCSSSPTLFDPDFTDPERQNYPNRNVLAARSRFSAESMNTSGSVSSRENTLLHEGGMAANPAPDSVTIIMPDFISRVSVSMNSIASFVAQYTPQAVEISVTHLLLYTFATHVDDPNLCINHLKLLHLGKQYSIQTLSDLHQPQPPLQSICSRFATFQLFITDNLVSVPLALPMSDLIQRSLHVVRSSDPDRPVTYADAMLRIIRKRSRRKSSVSSVASSRTSGASVTDVEEPQSDADISRKMKATWKRFFHKQVAA
ncbi:hypothetical protein EJF18_60060 [Clavispora lusitaniae]|uniref:Uncharacterized protein n=1 Tax=Clavispora lusitaniae TaxID=36911 RepID=A0ACD0WQ74_CLALS|nr:hypothetical protein EJF14_60060 [Clavispora lusitaniae]QFZ35200.1 hypothetical protein EJF16_60060 [Clavispora lusitaniae]QFZ40894.1 hypothetical protein EJF15_60060 [Clavispora lusitaniae]QFZ46575.1 hypothetical protein EJF18_60060 [Clavispora lusitaniae]QFZ52240.1 hypothetical protein EJF17_60060 [Clavispora lusitaniae]